MKKIIIGFLALSLVGCAVHTPNGSVIVDPKGKNLHKHAHKHCPPGQAKKGRC